MRINLTKKDLINQIYMQLGFSKLVTESLINDFLSTVILNLKEEKKLSSDPKDWYVRSEKETLCRFHEDYSLFTINVLFEPLKEVLKYPEAKNALVKSLHSFDEDEEVYFGGKDKIKALLEYLKT